MLSFLSVLFYRKSLALREEETAKELRKALLMYIEKEEKFPQTLDKISFNNRGLEVSYEFLENGRGCRFKIDGRKYELWDEKR